MKRLIFLVMIMLAAFAACDQTPTEQDNTYTFERYDTRSRPLGTVTAWYCTTNAQYASAFANHEAGDIVYLVSPDTVYVHDGGAWEWWYADVEAITTAQINVVGYLGTIDFSACDVDGIYFTSTYSAGVTVVQSGGTMSNCVLADEYNGQIYGWSGAVFDNITWDDLDGGSGGLTWQNNSGGMTIMDSEIGDGSDCDDSWINAANPYPTVESWQYNGSHYSYDAIGAFTQGPYTYTPTKCLVKASVVGDDSYDNLDIISAKFYYTANEGSCTFPYNTTATYESGTGYWKAVLDIHEAFAYTLVLEMCDSTYVGGCWTTDEP